MLRIAGVEKESIVDGPGIRYTIFTQGCNHRCKGCHNVHTWDKNGGYSVNIEDLYEDIVKNPLLKGVTISGGEPFDQAYEVSYLIQEYLKKNKPNMDVIVYTGYKFEDLVVRSYEDIPVRRLLCSADYIIDGEYVESERCLSLSFRGSKNQRIIDVKKSMDIGEIVEVEL